MMFVAIRFVEGLVVAHAWIAIAYLTGSLFFSDSSPSREGGRAAQACRFVVVAATGFAIVGTVAFLLGVFGWLTLPALATAALTLVLGAASFRRTPIWSPLFWRRCGTNLAGCCSWSTLIVYAWFLCLAWPAVIPSYASDGQTFHVALAQDIANHHKIVVDPYLMFPLFANNFELIFAITLLVKGGAHFINFIPWSAGLLTAIAMCGAIESIPALPRKVLQGLSVVAVLAISISPTFLTWLTTGFIDVPDGYFALATMIGLQYGMVTRRTSWFAMAALSAGFLCGMKMSFVILVPMFAGLLFVAMTIAKFDVKRRMLFAAMLMIVASPWYVRNLIVVGDPVPPTINLALRGADPYFSEGEWKALVSVTHPDAPPQDLITLPWRMFVDTSAWEFREQGTTALSVLIFLPFLALLVLIWRHALFRDPVLSLYVVALVGFCCYWQFTAHLARYTLLFYPCLAVFVVLLLARGADRMLRVVRPPWRAVVLAIPVAALLLTAIPTPAVTPSFFRERYEALYRDLRANYRSDQQYLMTFSSGYAVEQLAVEELHRRGIYQGTVYLADPSHQSEVFFRRDGFMSAGGWDGPGAYDKIEKAVEIDELRPYLVHLDVVAVVVNAATFFRMPGPLVRALGQEPFDGVLVPSCACILFVRKGPRVTGRQI